MGLLLLCGTVQAQEVTVTGRVDDFDNKPLPGVTILIRGTQQGTLTDAMGNYTLTNVTSSSVLIYSFIGFKTVEETVGTRSTINVVLEENVSVMDEVVVVGYGTVKKRDLTGSVSSVKADVVPMTSVASVTHSLQGKAAGLIVMQNSAQPGGGLDILIRGQSSINAGNEPLYIVDGFPIVTLDQPNASSSGRTATGTQGPLNFLNPSDIVSIEVLKDASATAIYGSRAANGVILITTARGKEGKPAINFSASTGIQNYIDRWDTFRDLGEWMNEVNAATFESWLGERAVYPYGGNPTGADRKTVEQALVPPDRDLQPRGPEVHAGRQGPGHVLPRGQGRADPAGRHQRTRRHGELDRRGDLVLDEQPHPWCRSMVLLDVRFPARSRSHLERRPTARRAASCSGRRPGARRFPARGCSTKMDRATSMLQRFRPAVLTIRRLAMKWP